MEAQYTQLTKQMEKNAKESLENETKYQKVLLELNSKALIYITKLIKEEDRRPKLLTIVIMKAHDDDNEKIRVLSKKFLMI